MTATLAAALMNSIVLGSIIAIAVTLLLRVIPRSALNAATRYAVLWIALAIIVFLPCARLPLPSWTFRRPPPVAAVPVHRVPAIPAGVVADRSPDPETGAIPPAAAATAPVGLARNPVFAVRTAGVRWPGIILSVCGVLSAIMLLRLILSYIALERMKRRAIPATPSQSRRAEEWLAACGSRRRKVQLKISTEISSPFIAGPVRAAILVPAAFFTGLSGDEADAAGLHEAAHLARRDDYALFLQRAIEALLAWHPAVRWISRQIDFEREVACDDFVVAASGNPRSYASCLTRLAELASLPASSLLAAGVIEEGRDLARRIDMLLDRTRHAGTRLLHARLAGVALVPLILALCAMRVPRLIAFPPPEPQQSRPAAPQVQSTPAAPQVRNEAAPTPAEPVQWIKANAIPLSTVQAGHGFDDMQPIAKIVGNARIVALGEATHGTREFFQLKHRMVEFLASKMGFTIFSIEANMPEAYRLNDYVLNGKGDPATLLKGMYFWTWDTKEVLEMIQWMREFNQSGKGRIEFTGFDMQTPNVAAKIVSDFVAANEPDYLSAVKKAPITVGATANRFTTDTGQFPAEDAAGKTIRFSADIKTSGVTEYAGLWWRADGVQDGVVKPVAFRNLGGAAPKGTTDWKRYELEIAVPPETKSIYFGALLAGGGTAWFDGLKVEIDGQPYTKAQGFALIHKGELPKSNFLYIPGYAAAFRTEESRGQVLELRRLAPMDPAGPDAKQASAEWKAIVDHMDGSRSTYLAHGAAAKDIDWAVQNARVVLQCMQMKANEITRDRAMADNVKWILDHSPKAKIVLWAHNGHVGSAPGQYRAMGAELRGFYGDQMVVFGFAFNQGSFRAVEQGKSLRDFTVGPAPAGGFDATLTAAGIPVFALDLRRSPAESAAGAWLQAPHKVRSIGAVYSEDQPANYFTDLIPQKTYDAILFVERTTAALPNKEPIVICSADQGEQSCRDKANPVSFRLPAGWSVRDSWRWGDQENTIALTDSKSQSQQTQPSLYYHFGLQSIGSTVDEIQIALQKSAEGKVNQRRTAGLADYHLRDASCQARTIGGHPARSCIAEFTNESGEHMVEYLTWVRTQSTAALFFGPAPADASDRYRARFDAIIETLQIP
jgi:erythromycin esterase-like protein/beta-lactamase regulating signal transducer with metallopeptidase domain